MIDNQPLPRRIVSIGECMIEMSGGEDRTYRLGYAGDTLTTAWHLRALLGKDWSVDYVTGLGEDRYSADIRAFLDGNNIGTGHIQTIHDRRPGLYMIHQEKGDLAKARKHYQRALDMNIQIYGEDHANVAMFRDLLGGV